MKHPITALYDDSGEITEEIDARERDTRDHLRETQRIVDEHHPRRLTLTLTDIISETPTTVTFRLARPDGSALPPFLAGQYITVFADGTSRAYAMSSSPTTLSHYDLTVRRVAGGRVSNHLIDNLAVGDTVTTTGPMGTFHHNPLFHGDDVVFIAGGSGVVPALSMIREIVDRGNARNLHLVYGSREHADIIFRDELEHVVRMHPNISVTHVVGGLVTAESITEAVGDLAGRMVYVCGPQALYPYALEQLAALGHPRIRIRLEANGAPAHPERDPSWPGGVAPDDEVEVTAGALLFRSPRNRPLLDALEDRGIRPEAACRSGECSLCRFRVLKGEVHQAQEAQPRMSDAAFGYVHSCVAYPITDVELEV